VLQQEDHVGGAIVAMKDLIDVHDESHTLPAFWDIYRIADA
jgi:hypothetical protein